MYSASTLRYFIAAAILHVACAFSMQDVLALPTSVLVSLVLVCLVTVYVIRERMTTAAAEAAALLAEKLVAAAAKGDMAGLRERLAAGAKPDSDAGARGRALNQAAAGGHVDVLRALCAAGAAVNGVSEWSGATALGDAARAGQAEAAAELCSLGADPNKLCSSTSGDESPLALASARGHLPVVQALLARGAAVVVSPGTRAWPAPLQPLHVAIQNGHKSVVAALLEAGAPVDVPAVQAAARCDKLGRLDILQQLLAKAKVTKKVAGAATEGQGLTADELSPALCDACRRGHLDAALALLGVGVPATAATEYGFTALMLAVETSTPSRSGSASASAGERKADAGAGAPATVADRVKLVRALCAAGADVNACDESSYTDDDGQHRQRVYTALSLATDEAVKAALREAGATR